MKRPVNVCGRSLSLLLLICLAATARVPPAHAQQSTELAPEGSVTLTPEEVRDQTILNLECEGLATEVVLTRRERDVEREGRLEAIESAKLYRKAAEDYKASAELERTRGDGYRDAYESEVRKGKWRLVKSSAVVAIVAFAVGVFAGK